MRNEFEPLVRTVRLMSVELAELTVSGPRFLIVHRLWQPETICTPGELVSEIRLLHRTKEVSVPLSLRLMLLFDYLARHRHSAQCAVQIAAGLTVDPFSRRHGAHATVGRTLPRGLSRTAVKQQVMRLRAGLRRAFRKAGLTLDPGRVLLSEKTTTNEIHYRLRASVTWQHIEF